MLLQLDFLMKESPAPCTKSQTWNEGADASVSDPTHPHFLFPAALITLVSGIQEDICITWSALQQSMSHFACERSLWLDVASCEPRVCWPLKGPRPRSHTIKPNQLNERMKSIHKALGPGSPLSAPTLP